VRIAVLADIHGNLRNLTACLHAIDAVGVDEIWCLGDVTSAIGEADPDTQAQCVRLIEERCSLTLAGNHDVWSLQRRLLPVSAALTVAGWQPILQHGEIVAVHAAPFDPLMEWISDPAGAEQALRLRPIHAAAAAAINADLVRIILFAHTHKIAAWALGFDDELAIVTPLAAIGATADLSRWDRTLLNPGAVAGPEPSWMLLDTADRVASWRSFPAPPGR